MCSYETWFYWDTPGHFYAFTAHKFADVSFPEHLKGHQSSPFVWIERPASSGSGENAIEPIGGCDHFRTWIQKNFAGEEVLSLRRALGCILLSVNFNFRKSSPPLGAAPQFSRTCFT
jgi:hypothetical protein